MRSARQKMPLGLSVSRSCVVKALDQAVLISTAAYSPKLWAKAASSKAIGQITVASVYATASDIESLASASVPIVQHLAGVASHKLQRTSELFQYAYEDMKTPNFAIPNSTEFHY